MPQINNHHYSVSSTKSFQGKAGSSGLPSLSLDLPGDRNVIEIEDVEDPLMHGTGDMSQYRRMKAAYDAWTETEHKRHQEVLKLIGELPESCRDSLKDAIEASERAWMNLYGKESTLIRKIYEQHEGNVAKSAQMYDLMTLMKARAQALQRRLDILRGCID